jgi:hypothetical protein
MRRIVLSGACVGLVALALGASGCSGGGIEAGIPQDTKPQPLPPNIQTKMGPAPKKMPTPGKVGLLHAPAWPTASRADA